MSDTTRRVWERQHRIICIALKDAGMIFEVDGAQYVDESYAPDLADLYQTSVQIGYARGWL